MNNIKCTSLRFNLDKPLDRQAWEYLQGIDKEEFKSYSHAVVLAVTEYFKRYYHRVDDPYFETWEREERFVEQIVAAVEAVIEKALPTFLAACFSKLIYPYIFSQPTVEVTNNNPSDADIDMDFVGG